MPDREIWVEGDKIVISFPFSKGMIMRLKEELADYTFNSARKVWRLPATQFHAKKVRDFAREYGFTTDAELTRLASTLPGTVKANMGDFEDKLYPFQKEGVNFLIQAQGRAIIADEMGLGKTIETLCYLAIDNAQKILVVAPASVIYKWQAEIQKWVGWRSQIVKTGKTPLEHESRVHIMSYGLLATKMKEIAAYEYDTIIYDECHYLASPESQRTRAAKLLGADHRVIGLSGTPFLNRPIEMHTFLSILDPLAWGNRWTYAKRYCDAKQTNFGWDFNGSSNPEELRERLDSILLRRTKRELGDQLPALQRSMLLLDADTKNYHRIIRNNVLSKKQRLLQAYHEIGRLKVDTAVSLAQDILEDPHAKVVIYAHHKDVVSDLFDKMERTHTCLTVVGDDSKEDRAAGIMLFQQEDGPRVMIISEAGGEGIDLYRASNIIFCERAWNPGREEQAEARLHRIGQINPVTAHYLIVKDTADEKMSKLIDEKREVFKKIVLTDEVETNVQNEMLKFMEGD